ncbi:porin [Marinobacterium sp. xm-d-530]|uniref:porin n=1 Tax=Marinobacterium sp. xm-d-530 TaxID=2497747 RepID=UPI00156888A3|nr:porin [Marinobacterium sp. xm-d-530]NRQ01709.1 hypothetical protein [Marinobacterium sp. xm-d-530]
MKKILAVAVATAISAPAMADLTIGASTEYNLASEDSNTTQSIETNITATGTATSETGLFVKAFIELEAIDAGDASNALDIDDNYFQIGNAAAALTVGQFGTKRAFKEGDDSFEAANVVTNKLTAAEVFKGNSDDDAGDAEFALDITAVEGLDLQISGNYTSDTDTDSNIYAAYTFEGVTLAANMQTSEVAADEGYAVSATTTLGGATVSVSFADGDADNTATGVTANMNGFDVTYVRFENADGESETSYYGAYNVGDLGVTGLNIDLGAGSGSDRETKMGVEVSYSF